MVPTRDEQLIVLIAQGNSEAYSILFERYYALTKKVIFKSFQTVFVNNQESESFEMFFFEVFNRILATYRPGFASFKKFFNAFLNKTMKGKIYLASSSNDALFHSVSLNSITIDDCELIESVPNFSIEDPRDEIRRRNIELVLRSPSAKQKNSKNELQRKILEMRYDGFKFREIAQILEVPLSTVKRLSGETSKGTPLSKIILQFK